MSKIDEMLKQMCPDGVEYVELGEVCDFITGFPFKSSTFCGEGLPVCRTTNIQNGYIDFSNMVFFQKNDYPEDLNKFIIRKNDIVIGMSGTIKVGINRMGEECYLNQRVGKFLPGAKLDCKYLYYVLCNSIDKIADGIGDGSVKNLSNKDIKGFRIPLPPLEIQKEVVKVLDKFTEYDTELQAELQARIKQYEYYRDKLLNFDEFGVRGGVAYKELGDLCSICRGERITKSDISSNGEYPVISGGKGPMGRYASYNREGDTITIASYGAAGYVDWQKERFWANDVCLSIFPNDGLDKKFVYYFLKSQQVYLYTRTTKAIPDHIPTSEIKKIMVPVPPLEIQSRIVSVLDNFDKICSDLRNGLPAEIEKRRRQYGYYRDKILAFSAKK